VPRSIFGLCSAAVSRSAGLPTPELDNASRALNGTFCQQSDSRVVFSDTQLTCPSWSTIPTRGVLRLDVDAAFLGFWGCACPPDFYWGYLQSRDLVQESTALRAVSEMSLGERERVLQARTCLPCPTDLPVRCSPLAVLDPPHVVTHSVYPFAPPALALAISSGNDHESPAGLARSVLPYLIMSVDQIRACLHPAVCGGDPTTQFVGDNWTDWAQLASNGAAFSAPFAQFQCRVGHDAATPLCAGCNAGFWLDGFLCRRCFSGAEVLVVLGVLAGLGGLCYVLWRHNRATSPAADTGPTDTTGRSWRKI
jgi:hypothetical protein